MSAQRRKLSEDDLEEDSDASFDAVNSTELTDDDTFIDDSIEDIFENSLNSEIIGNSLEEKAISLNLNDEAFQKDQNKKRYQIIDSSDSGNEMNYQEKRRSSKNNTDKDSVGSKKEAGKPRKYNVIDSDDSSDSENENSSENINKSNSSEIRKSRQNDVSKVKNEPRKSLKYSIDSDDSDAFQDDGNKNNIEIILSDDSDNERKSQESLLGIESKTRRLSKKHTARDNVSSEKEARKPRKCNVIDSDDSSDSENKNAVENISFELENKLKLSSDKEIIKSSQSTLSEVRKSLPYSIDSDDSDHSKISFKQRPHDMNKGKNINIIDSNGEDHDIGNSLSTPTVIIDSSESDKEVKPKLIERKKIHKQTTLDHMLVKSDNQPDVKSEINGNETIEVSSLEYNLKQNAIRQLEVDLANAKELQKTINLQSLPDKGALLIQREKNLKLKLDAEREKFSKMVSKGGDIPLKKLLSWDEIKLTADQVQPKTFGKQAMNTYTAQKAMTMDTLEHLHKSLAARPLEDDAEDDPKGLTVTLMLHQKRALKWLLWRETQKPSGGILADDMGLGKTLTMISLMLKSTKKAKDNGSDDSDDETNEYRKKHKYPGGTLVICPASLLNQWSGEVTSKVNRGRVSYYIHHGAKRETNPRKLADYDLVITTYSLVMNEAERNGCVLRVFWRRIILDEAHQIRNHKSHTSVAICRLAAKSRWALTGTPIHNKELDMYALLKFLRCVPFDDLAIWKIWVADKSAGGQERLHTVISSLLLRRTKAELVEQQALAPLPERHWEVVEVKLAKAEMEVYSKILLFSRTLFAQFLHQRADKKQLNFDFKGQMGDPNSEFTKMREKLLKFNKAKEVKQLEILVLLLRLRQICCHPCLITKMLVGKDDLAQEYDEKFDDENKEEMDLLEMLNKMHLEDTETPGPENITPNMQNTQDSQEKVCLSDACKGVLNPSDPIFSEHTPSSKIKVIVDVINSKIAKTNDKAIVISQWTSMLKIVGFHLKKEGIQFDELNGTIPVRDRMNIVDNINNPNHKVKVLLLSLTAGGVGLNLVGANHLFFLDLHWNPQLESQAQDRIYRIGQKKPVFIYKFMAVGTIEEQIKNLQERKLEIAETMLSGTRKVISSKLSLTDLRMIFNM